VPALRVPVLQQDQARFDENADTKHIRPHPQQQHR
jgi:hypothetical protein